MAELVTIQTPHYKTALHVYKGVLCRICPTDVNLLCRIRTTAQERKLCSKVQARLDARHGTSAVETVDERENERNKPHPPALCKGPWFTTHGSTDPKTFHHSDPALCPHTRACVHSRCSPPPTSSSNVDEAKTDIFLATLALRLCVRRKEFRDSWYILHSKYPSYKRSSQCTTKVRQMPQKKIHPHVTSRYVPGRESSELEEVPPFTAVELWGHVL